MHDVQMTTVAEASFETLFTELASKSSVPLENLREMIQQKKMNVGGGYLTDQGALFLVAADLGVMIEYDPSRPVSLSRLTSNQSSVKVVARLLSVGGLKFFNRKSDGKRGALLRGLIYDESTTIAVSMWDTEAVSLAKRDDFLPGDLYKISNAYVRSSQDGSLSLNLGEKAIVERIPEDQSRQIKSLEEFVRPLSSLPENQSMLATRGQIEGDVRRSTFTRRDGSRSELTSFTICDLEDRKVRRRVVVWGNQNPALSRLSNSQVITLLNFRTKLANFQNTASVEIHGDENTCIYELLSDTKKWLIESAKSFESSANTSLSRNNEAKPFPVIARVLSLRTDEGRGHLLLLDSTKKMISVNIEGQAITEVERIREDDIVICKPDAFDSEGRRVVLTTSNSIVKSNSKRPDIPVSQSLFRTVEKLENGVVSLDIMCLTDPIDREIQTKDGLVKRTEITVADHTGEIKVYGWRSLSKLLHGHSAGDKVLLSAVEVQTHEGKKFIVIKNYSTMSKKGF